MKFSRVVGKIDQKLVAAAEDKLSQVFLDLAVKYDNKNVGSKLGGDPMIFSLVYPVEHICTINIPTAATDGRRFYWNPKFVLKHSLIGLRILCTHESAHALYLHPQRRGSRIPKLWNIAVDYIVNGMVMDDLKSRGRDAPKEFTNHLGKFMTLKNYMEFLKNPFDPKFGLLVANSSNNSVSLPSPNDDRELTEKEKKELERRDNKEKFYFADPDLEEDWKRPEKIYDALYQLLPKCPKCGSVGKYPIPKNQNKSDKKSDKDSDQGSNKDKCNHGCDQCGDGFDPLSVGDLMDEHMDTEESEEKLAKRIADAMESAKRMAGKVPAAMEDELGKLTAPKVTWQDVIRTRLSRARAGHGRNDYTRFKTRPMFAGLMFPKKRNVFAKFGVLLDTSGSMSKDDMAFGISQLQSLDEKGEGTITPADAQIYWSDSTPIKRASSEELSKIKIVGRGGTMFASYFDDYEKYIGKCDLLIIITDSFLLDQDIAAMRNPGVPVVWLVTSQHSSFVPPFGRAFFLRD